MTHRAIEPNKIYCGDCLDVMGEMEDNSVDTVITDPPYGYNFMSKNWDYGIPGVPFWTEMLRVAKPGAMLLAFGGTRTHHRLMVAIEDAGWEIKDCMMWLYAQGFPKSLNIGKSIDRQAGMEREVVGHYQAPNGRDYSTEQATLKPRNHRCQGRDDRPRSESYKLTAPATDAAKLFDGWGTALKPSWEPIIVAMKPIDGTFANNALTHGVAGLWVDGARIGTEDSLKGGQYSGTERKNGACYGEHKNLPPEDFTQPSGRFPSNTLLSHHPSCQRRGTKRVKTHWGQPTRGNHKESLFAFKDDDSQGRAVGYADPDGLETVEAWECVEDCAVHMLGKQSSHIHSAGSKKSAGGWPETKATWGTYGQGEASGARYGDRGDASRFFLLR